MNRLRSARHPAVLVVVVLHLLGWGLLISLVLPLGIALGRAGGAPIATLGIALTAYTLGLRHAFDADHIAAIDNTTRRLIALGRPSGSVGFWFSLGHSTVVFVLCLLLVAFGRLVAQGIANPASPLRAWAGIIGPTVSGIFLLAVAAMNIVGLRSGQAHASGPVTRLLGRSGMLLDRPSRMFIVGLLFGLGFDTATEIGLLALAGSASVVAVPWWAVLTLPILFAAGMSALDTLQGAFVRRAYGWGQDHARVTRLAALGMTLVSVAVAVSVGAVELASVGSSLLDGHGPLAWVANIGVAGLGLALTAVIAVAAAVVKLTARNGRPPNAVPMRPIDAA